MTVPPLREIHLNNFKSYVGTHHFGPFSSFSCIVGPNGSGKSNFTDAIGFVLGIDPRHMRVNSIRDFISHGEKQTSVTMCIDIDGARRTIHRELVIQGDTEHMRLLVDDQDTTQDALGELLASSGVLIDLKNFLIFQNEVEAITLKKSRDLTEIIERISGSGSLKAEYDDLRSKLEGINKKIGALALEKKEIVGEINRYRAQRKDNERFTDLHAKEKKANVFKNLYLLLVNEGDLAEKREMLAHAEMDVERLEKAYNEHAKEIKAKKQAFAEAHKEHLRSMQHMREKASAHRDASAHYEKIRTMVDHLQRQRAQADREHTVKAKSLEALHENVSSVQTALDSKEAEQAAFEAKCQAEMEADASMKLTKAQLDEYKAVRKEVDCQTVLLRQKRESIRKRQTLMEDAVRRDEALLKDTEASVKSVEESIRFASDSTQGLELSHKEAQVELNAAKGAYEAFRTSTEQTAATLATKEKELQSITAQINVLQGSQEESKQAKRISDALTAMKALTRGVRGRLVDLCSIPNERYRVAATVALGKNIDSIVVETQAQAMSCINYLKENRVGIMEFIPLDSAKGKHVDERCRGFGGTCRPIIDVFKYDAWLEPAVRYALGQTLVCDTIEEAMRVAHNPFGPNYAVVTLDGSIILKNGAIQGGLQSVQQKARKWDEKEFSALKEKQDKLQVEIFEASGANAAKNAGELETHQQKISAAQKRCSHVTSEINALNERLDLLRAELATLEASRAKTALNCKRSADAVKALEKEVDEATKEVRDLEQKAFAKLQKKIGKKCDLLEWEEQKDRIASRHGEKRQQLILQVSVLRNKLAVEQKRLDLHEAADANVQLVQLEKRIASLEAEMVQQQQVVQEKQQDATSATKQFDEVRKKLLSTESAIRSHTKANAENSEAVGDARKRALVSTVGCKKLRSERANLFLRSVLDNYMVPFVFDAPEVAESEAKRQRKKRNADAETEARSASESLKLSIRYSEPFDVSDNPLVRSAVSSQGSSQSESYSICVDFTSVPEKQRIAFAQGKHADELVTLERSLEHIREEIRVLSPSIQASQQQTKHEEALGKLNTALDAQKTAYKTHMTTFHKVQDTRRTKFQQAFDSINTNVGEIYKQLTQGTRGTIEAYGSAYLTLDNAEEPYLHGTKYHATPPLKRFMGMEALSGGERTMAAMALLFAFYTVKPAPFIVLDEVDAALDHANVQKLSEYIQRHIQTCQFIVVSLNAALYGQADALFGVYKDKARDSSSVLSLDLASYPQQVE